jgi:hypothetical protein
MKTATPWHSLTEQEKTAWIAETIMGWAEDLYPAMSAGDIGTYWIKEHKLMAIDWYPLIEWNHWRQVEEHIMQDEKLWNAFLLQYDPKPHERSIVKPYMQSGLPARCQALYSAYQSLQ